MNLHPPPPITTTTKMMTMAEFHDSDYEVDYETASDAEDRRPNGRLRARNRSPPGLDMREYDNQLQDHEDGEDLHNMGREADWREHHPLLSEEGGKSVFKPLRQAKDRKGG